MIPEVFPNGAAAGHFPAGQGGIGIAQDVLGGGLERSQGIDQGDFPGVIAGADIRAVEIDGETTAGGDLK